MGDDPRAHKCVRVDYLTVRLPHRLGLLALIIVMRPSP